MIDERDILGPVDDALNTCFVLTADIRKTLYDTLFQLVKDKAAPAPDLDVKMERFGKSLEKMTSRLEIKWDGKRYHVEVGPQDRDVFILIKRGSLWFNGMDDVEDVIIGTVIKT